MEVNGQIENILDVVKGTTKDGKGWQKIGYVVKTKDEFNNLYYFEIFGEEKVTEFLKYNKKGREVKVSFNVKTNEYKGKYYTSLQSWKIEKLETAPDVPLPTKQDDAKLVDEIEDDLPF